MRQNAANRGKYKGTSGQYKGVHLIKKTGRWHARISSEGKLYLLGYFKCEKEAARAYNEAAKKYHGEFAYLNDV